MTTKIEREKQRARAVAEEYRRKGYEVLEEPTVAQLPDFLSGFQPDLLVKREGEAVIVEVKARSSLARSPEISQLAQLLRGKPGWDFELVILGESGLLDLPEDTQSPGKEFIAERIAESDSLLEAGHSEAALLMVWSALEATIRMLNEEEVPSQSLFDSPDVLKHAVANGLISRDDYHSVTKVFRYRNALAHGLKVPDFEFSVAYSLIKDLIQRLLQPEA